MEREFHGLIKKSIDDPEGKWELIIEARPATEVVDRYNEITLTSAFMAAMPKFMAGQPVMMFNHDRDWTIGKVLDYRADDVGPIITGGISKTERGKEVAQLIRDGVVTAMSFQFGQTKYEMDTTTNISKLTAFELYEIGPVSVPANPTAVITMAKAIEDDKSKLNQPDKGKERKFKMDVNDIVASIEKKVGGFTDSLDTVTKSHVDIQKKQTDFARMLTELGQKQEAMFADQITKGEFATFAKKIGDEIMATREELQTIEKARKIESKRIPFQSWKYGLNELPTMYDDNGKPWSDVRQKAFRLFCSPLDYKSAPDGEKVKALRDLHDALITLDAVFKGTGNRTPLEATKTFALYRELLEDVDPDFAKAMSTSGTGVGLEWLSVGYSAELYDLYRLESNIEALFPSFEMPTKSFVWPFQLSGAKLYRAGEPTTNNPAIVTKSNVGTGQVTFTAYDLAVAVPVSSDLIEDSIIGIVNKIRTEIGKEAARGYESAIVNMDATATHHDNASNTLWASNAPETCETGLMEHALTDSLAISSASTSSGVGDASAAFTAEDLRYLRVCCGILGKDPRKFVYACSIKGWFRMLNFTQMQQGLTYLNQAGSWLTGELPPFDGCKVVVSAAIPDNVANSGLYTDGTTASAFTFVLGFNPEGFMIGNRRGFTLEFANNIETRQYVFVGSMRKSFQRMALATASRYPVAASIAIAI